MKLLEFLTTEKWTKYQFAIDDKGKQCTIHSDKAKCFCLMGAIFRVYPKAIDFNEVINKIKKVLKKKQKLFNYLPKGYCKFTTDTSSIVNFNDSSSTKFSDVQEVIKEAGV